MRVCLSEMPVFELCLVHLASSYKFHESQLIILMLILLIVRVVTDSGAHCGTLIIVWLWLRGAEGFWLTV